MSGGGEADLYILADSFGCMEEIVGLELEPAGEHVAGKSLYTGVVSEGVLVVELARVSHLLFGVAELALKLFEVLGGLKLRIVFRDSHEAPDRGAEDLIGGGGGRRPGGFGKSAAGFGHFGKDGVFVLGVSADRLHQIGNEAGAPLELDVDAGPRFARPIAREDQ